MHAHMYVGIAYIPGSNHEEIYRLFELGAKTGAVTFIHNRGNMDDLTVLITRHYLFYNSRTLLGCSTPPTNMRRDGVPHLFLLEVAFCHPSLHYDATVRNSDDVHNKKKGLSRTFCQRCSYRLLASNLPHCSLLRNEVQFESCSRDD